MNSRSDETYAQTLSQQPLKKTFLGMGMEWPIPTLQTFKISTFPIQSLLPIHVLRSHQHVSFLGLG